MTKARAEKEIEMANFNSHARVGRDRIIVVNLILLQISTHTPAWGVTYHDEEYTSTQQAFQLTRPRGA